MPTCSAFLWSRSKCVHCVAARDRSTCTMQKLQGYLHALSWLQTCMCCSRRMGARCHGLRRPEQCSAVQSPRSRAREMAGRKSRFSLAHTRAPPIRYDGMRIPRLHVISRLWLKSGMDARDAACRAATLLSCQTRRMGLSRRSSPALLCSLCCFSITACDTVRLVVARGARI